MQATANLGQHKCKMNNPLLTEPIPKADITVVGLGPGALNDLTLGAWQALQNAHTIWFRTQRHPCIPPLTEHLGKQGIPIHTFDALYEKHDQFADVYAAIVQRLLAGAATGTGIVYAVPGHPSVGEATTPLLLNLAAAQNRSVHLIGGISFVEAAYTEVGQDIMNGGQVVDAMLLAQQHHPQVEPSLPLLVGQVYSRAVASDLKLTLLNAYPPDHQVTVLAATGTAHALTRPCPLHELDHGEHFDHLTSLYVPPLPEYGSITALQELVAHLRAPEGCPWDREQTLASLRADLLDECAEVLEAIDLDQDGSDNSDHIAEELGDLLLVATMLIQIATEEERFQMGDVARGVVTKLIRRHPHVFENVAVEDVDEIVSNWDAIKAQEKQDRGEAARGPLDGVPAHLPALQKARKLQSKAHKAGLLDRAELATSNSTLADLLSPSPTEEGLGKLLWQLVAVARAHGLNAEDALRNYSVRFKQENNN